MKRRRDRHDGLRLYVRLFLEPDTVGAFQQFLSLGEACLDIPFSQGIVGGFFIELSLCSGCTGETVRSFMACSRFQIPGSSSYSTSKKTQSPLGDLRRFPPQPRPGRRLCTLCLVAAKTGNRPSMSFSPGTSAAVIDQTATPGQRCSPFRADMPDPGVRDGDRDFAVNSRAR